MWFTVPVFLLVGSVLGSFGNVLVERLHSGASLNGRSHCVDCTKRLRVWELVPVFSWLALYGRCARCKSPIPAVYTLVELGSGLLFVMALIHVQFDVIQALPLSVALWAMLCIAIGDIRTHSIPDILTIIVAVCGVVLRAQDNVIPLLPVLIALVFFGGQWLVSKGRWVGSGDILLSAALGIVIGTWQLMLLMLWFAYVLGLVFVLALLPFRRLDLNAHIPFGPFLVLGTIIPLLFGDQIIALLF